MSYLRELPMFSTFCDVKPIHKGMSGDKKYYVTTTENQRLLLRISDPQDFQRKQTEYWLLKQFAELKIPMSQPVDFGIFGEDRKVYTLLTWIDGEEAETKVPRFSKDEQYQIGREAGRILKSIHSIPANAMDQPWKKRYFSVISERLTAFLKEGERFPGWEIMMDYIDSNRNLLDSRPQVYLHGDYHMGNLIISPQNELSVIDWHTVDFDNIGDPWYEFNRIGMEYPYFAAGQIDGYFRDSIPDVFWQLLAYYLSVSTITSIVWAKYFAPERLRTILTMNTDILCQFDNMKQLIPTWYTIAKDKCATVKGSYN